MTLPTAPGWYEDPEDPDQLRYFDGIVWSTHTTPLRSPTAASSTIGRVSGAETGPEQRPADPSSGPAGPPGRGSTAARTAVATMPDGAVLAEWWRRLFGRAVDYVLTSVVAGLLLLPFIGPLVTAFEGYLDDVVAGRTPDMGAMQAATTEVLLPVTLVSMAVGLVYEIGFLVWRSATPGKMLLGTVVRPAAAPGRVSAGVALRRQLIAVTTSVLGLNAVLEVVAFMLSVLDPAWLLWDPRRQCLHDKVADTVVVRRG